MRLLCLCPTFRRPHLLANLIACFEAQDHPDKFLLMLDDSGQIAGQEGDGWKLLSRQGRYATLTAKYGAMLLFNDWYFNAVALMDDDDIYGPQYLSSHATALGDARWSYPRRVFSTHEPPATSATHPGLEPSGGRFWASAAVRRDLLEEVGGFHDIARPTFDQEHLALWNQAGGEPGRPDDFALPQYVYGWGRAPRHVSLEMGDQAGWYANYAQRLPVMPPLDGSFLRPQMDAQTRAIYARCWKS